VEVKMSEMVTGTEMEMYHEIRTEGASLPEALRKEFMYPDNWAKEKEAVQIENEWLIAEREEVLGYIKTLKMLSLYLTGKTNVPREKLLNDYFRKAEQDFPEYLQKELEISVQI
jgi:hypothetical protein